VTFFYIIDAKTLTNLGDRHLMKDMKEFYEGYWKWRKDTDYLYKQGPPKRVAVAASMVSPVDGHPTRVLDIGCGEGSLGRILKERYGPDIHLVGTDISEQALELARQHYDEVYRNDAENQDIRAPFKGKFFDFIVCLEVLEHVFNPLKILTQASDLLTDGGQIIVSFPNFAFYRYRLDVLRGEFPDGCHIYSDVEHLHYFTLKSFEKLLADAGFKPVEIDGDFAAPKLLNIVSEGMRSRLTKAYPNLFGVQLVIRAVKG
jgi:methionine biosynthesis protein MetW